MPTININSVETNAKVYVDGIVDYSRIASLLEGEALAADNLQKQKIGMKPIDKPHTRMTISHAAVSYANPAAPTLAEQFIAEKLYASKKHPEKGACYNGMNKTKNLPEIYVRDSITSKKLQRITPAGEIAANVSVTLVLRFFATTMNKGVSLDAVIINEIPVRWASSGSGIGNSLEERGFEIVSDENSMSVDTVMQQLSNAVPAAAPVNTAYAQPAAVPSPAAYAQPIQPSAIPVQQAVSVAPAPVPAAAFTPTPIPTPAVVPTASYAASAAPVTAAVPEPAAKPARPIPPKGYAYDENNRLVPENQVSAPTGGIKL